MLPLVTSCQKSVFCSSFSSSFNFLKNSLNVSGSLSYMYRKEINEQKCYWMLFHTCPVILKVQHSHSRPQKATTDLLIINLKGKLWFNKIWPLEGAMYTHVQLYGKIFRGIPKMLVLCNFLKIFMVSDKTIHKAFRTHTTL